MPENEPKRISDDCDGYCDGCLDSETCTEFKVPSIADSWDWGDYDPYDDYYGDEDGCYEEDFDDAHGNWGFDYD